MKISKLDHVNIRTARLEVLVEWYTKVLDFRTGPRPDFPFPGAWLYTGDAAVVHLIGTAGDPGTGSESKLKLEHFAFAATGRAAFEKKLQEMDIPYQLADAPGFNITQVNLWDPDGNHLHVDFPADELPGDLRMKAVALTRYLPVDNPDAFVDVDLPKPEATGRDILVAVKAVSVNPVDTKVRRRGPADKIEDPPRVLGWDASGVVDSVGPDVTLFKPGDEVYYAGDITRSGSNAEFQLVDERIVGFKPKSLGFAEAAALPLTTITAYEAFFDRLGIDRDGADKGQSVLIVGAAGGVGSIGIQLAKAAGLVVIATASRPETSAWVTELGADHVVNHREPMVEQVRKLGFEHVDHVAIFNDMRHWETAVELIRPQGGIVSIDDTDLPMPMAGMKTKAASLHWEFMFARAMFETPDMIEQHNLLTYVAQEIDAGRIRTTLSETLTPINAENMKAAHALIERGTARGKVVVEGF